ncbi:MAG TPA: ABC transporter substrate-binding protein [Opitutaceae bacterium]|jgi:NitT/TauT family transport system substrate-binding protein
MQMPLRNRVSVALLSVAAALAGCSRSRSSADGPAGAKPFPIVVQLDWFAEPEHGGFYAAEAAGDFKAENLDVTLVQGGPNAYALQKVSAGQAQLAQADSTSVLTAIQSGAPVINVAAIFQHDPSVLMMRPDNPVKTWTDLDGKRIMARPDWAFLPYLRNKYHISFSVVPQNFDVMLLARDHELVQQGYYIAEPYRLAQQGIRLRYLFAWDTGFDSYTTLVANRDFARRHPAELKAFLRALKRGYETYFGGDPGPAHAIMRRINSRAEPGYLDWSRRQILNAHLDRSPGSQYLEITRDRYAREIEQLEELGLLRKGTVTPESAMDASYLP